MLVYVYRKFVPENIRAFIYWSFLRELLEIKRHPGEYWRWWKCRLGYLLVAPRTDEEKAYKEWGKAGLTPYPYTWKRMYDRQKHEVHTDSECGLLYVLHNGRRLYFRRGMTVEWVRSYYRSLLIEQDKRSSHRYVDSYEELSGKSLLDVGAAEGIFALDVIEFVRDVYLFECESGWLEALEKTFAPWKEKVRFIRRYVSDNDEGECMTLDSFFRENPVDNVFLKMDIEGYERKALSGAKVFLSETREMAGAVCIYHLCDDEKVIMHALESVGMKLSVVPGYIYFGGEMRRAVVRFTKGKQG